MGRVQRSTRAAETSNNVHNVVAQLSEMLGRMIPKQKAPCEKKLKRITTTANSISRLVRAINDAPEAEDAEAMSWIESLHDSTQYKKHRTKPSVEEE
ncbi:MAG: hypothetical protein FD177_925 [Desulfovibrionaceae bacterium]|nr:MAG: hypothetical protein FD177_925 [Desulfovibrionaceae bacterium]